MCSTISSSERSRCSHRFVVPRGTSQRLGDLLDAHALGCHLVDGVKFLCGADHSRGGNTGNTLDFDAHEAVVHGVCCVDVRQSEMGENLLFFVSYFQMGEGGIFR